MTRRLSGVGAVPGRVAGPAHVVDVEVAVLSVTPGAIVVARVFHPYFAPVLPRSAGLIVQEGGLLQHAVVLAREFGVPTVVGVAGAMTDISPGDHVLLDGTTGVILVEPPPATDDADPQR